MDPSDLAGLRKAHGKSVSCYLRNHNVGAQRTETGAFVIATNACFLQCHNLVTKQTELQSEKKKSRASNANKLTSVVKGKDRRWTPPPIKSGKETNIEPKNSFDRLGIATNLTIRFLSTSKKFGKVENRVAEPTLPRLPFSFSPFYDRRFDGRIEGCKLFAEIMSTPIGNQQMDGSKDCIRKIHRILEEFQIRHCDFDYLTVLQNILKVNSKMSSTNTGELTLKQYQNFVYKVFASVIPISLFGCHKNVKIMRKALNAYYRAPFEASFCLKKYIHKLEISRVPWLQKIKDPKTKHTVMAKIARWLVERFFLTLFKVFFYEQKSLYNEKKIIMSKAEWRRFQCDYIKRELTDGRVQKVDPNDDYNLMDRPSALMTLYPKPRGVRPIYRLRADDTEKESNRILRTFLQQQYLQRYDYVNFTKFHSTWLSYAPKSEEKTHRRVNVVTCDVSNAFGSISRDKLFDIVNRMINEIPNDNLPLKWYQLILPRKKGTKTEPVYKRWFSCCPAHPFLRKSSLITTSSKPSHETTYIKKAYIRTKLEQFIFGYRFEFKGKMYVLGSGIGQGSPVSPILSEIYYEHMKVEVFGIFMKSGNLSRYVDDFLYITKDKRSAVSFLKAIRKRVPEYNCRFKKRKIQENVRSNIRRRSKWITYLGFDLNGGTMEVRPRYENTEFQYVKWMQWIADKNSLKIFAMRSTVFACLKIQPIVQDSTINSLHGLCVTAQLTAKILAKRCVILVSTIFTHATPYRKGIMKQIHTVVTKLYRVFARRLTANDYSKWPNFQTMILVAIWRTFFQVFAKDPKLRELFCKDMKLSFQHRALL